MSGLRAVTGMLLAVMFLLMVSAPSFAEDIDVQWLVGTWRGTTKYGADRREVVFKADGTWTGDLQASATGLITQAGKYVIKGGTVTLDGTNQYGRPVAFYLTGMVKYLRG